MNSGLVVAGAPACSRCVRKFVCRFARLGVFIDVETIEPASVPDGGRGPSLRGMIEPFVSRHELARLMGVSIDTVDRLVTEGMPSVTWGRRTRRFRASVAIRWAEGRERVV
jgi:hypothetical protein